VAIEVSIVVPTHDRRATLRAVIHALERQRDAPPCELIVVDDGSTDGTADWLARSSFGLPTRVARQANRGPAAARNRGIDLATGHLVAFLGDDTIPDPGWLAAHARAHREPGGPRAVIGHTRWHERIRPTPFLRFINEQGFQFGWALIADGDDVPFNFFYGSNLSLPRELLASERFEERFPHAVWEDIELGYRLIRRHDLRLVYRPEASAAHDHRTTLGMCMARQERAGYSAVLFGRLHSELHGFLQLGPDGPPPLPPRGRHVVRCGMARAAERLPVEMPGVWRELAHYHYVRGLHRGWADRERLPAMETRG
jgi:glycosyltransferase involved in cell wall biosynthesis